MNAFVLGGGGAKGALQAGALRALHEAGLRPDLLVGTSVGAVNATYLAARGFTPEALTGLAEAWRDAAESDLLPDNYLWLTLRGLFNRQGVDGQARLREFFVRHGLRPGLRFGDLGGMRLILVAADLLAGGAVLYGTDPGQSVLEGVLASTAIPPWVRPLDAGDRLLMDGGVVSNLPIEPALRQGATHIVALDLADPRPVGPVAGGFGPFLFHLIYTVEHRHASLEKQLAAERGVPVYHVPLQAALPLAVWEFKRAAPLVERGYDLMCKYLEAHPELASRP